MTTKTHAETVKHLRNLIRRNVCSTLRVVMSRGSAWGNVKIKGSGEFGMFNENEKSALSKHNFNFGANCGIIMYENLGATIARLEKLATANSITGAGREAIKQTLQNANSLPFNKPHVTKTLKLSGNMVDGTDRDLLGNPTLEGDASPRTQPRYINIAAITDDGRSISTQIWMSDIDEAIAILDKWITPADEKWHGRISLAMIADPLTGSIRYRRHGEKLYVIEA
jgi:hypothetical protein